MVRIPHEVVGRTQPTERPLARRRQPQPTGVFDRGISESLGSFGEQLGRSAEVLQEARSREAALKTNLGLASFNLEQDRFLDDLNRNKDSFSNIDQTYEEQYRQKANEFLDNVEDPDAQALAFRNLTSTYLQNTLKAQEMERERNVAAVERDLGQQFETARNVVRTNPGRLEEQVDVVADSLQQSHGTLSRGRIEELSRMALQGMTESAMRGRIDRDPEQVMGELESGTPHTPSEAGLVYRESGGDPTAFNEDGFAGMYQFGAPRLSDLGVYNPGPNDNISEWEGTWSGLFNIPGHPEVENVDEFLASPEAQREVWKLHKQKMDQEIQDNNFDQFIGEHVQGTLITRQSLHNMLHLGGVGSTRQFLSGRGNPEDANGTSMKEYAQLGSQGPVSTVGDVQNILSHKQYTGLMSYAESVRDDQIARRETLETQSQEALERQQDDNYRQLQVGVARGEVGEGQLVEALDRNLIRPTQYQTLRDERESMGEDVSAETALQTRVKVLRGQYDVGDVMARSGQMTTEDTRELVETAEQVQRRGGVLARDDVQRELTHLEDVIAPDQGILKGVDPAAQERLVHAMREATDRIQDGEVPRQVVDDVISRYRPSPPTLGALEVPRWLEGGASGTVEDIKQRIGQVRQKFKARLDSGEISREEYREFLSEAIEYKRELEQVEQAQSRIQDNVGRSGPSR